MHPTLILPDSVSDFHDYFRLTPDFEEVANALGYSLTLSRPALPRSAEAQPYDSLRGHFHRNHLAIRRPAPRRKAHRARPDLLPRPRRNPRPLRHPHRNLAVIRAMTVAL